MKSPAWTRVIGAAVLLVFTGCAWFREPPGAGTSDTPGPKPMIALKTLPDTSEAPPPSPITPVDTTRTPAVTSPPPVTPPDLQSPPPKQESAEPFFTSPEGAWNLSGQTLTSKTGPEGQVTSIQAPVITHGEVVITATQGSYFVDQERVDLQGNVRFRDRKLTGRAPHAVYYRQQELLVADGGFIVDSDTLHLEGREGTYDREQDVVFVRDNVKGLRGRRTITSNEAEWFRGRSEVFFRGNAVVVDPKESTRLSGERIRYDLDDDRAEVLDSPRLVISTHEENPIDITGDRLRADPEGNLEAKGSVEIIRGEVRAKADSAFFDRDRHVAFLFGDPSVTQRDGSLTGDTLLLHFNRTDALERLQMHGNANLRFAPQDTARRGEVSTVRGDSLTMYFRGDTTDKVVVIGRAHSTYQPSPDDKSEGVGTNVVDGDTISILLTENKIERLVVTGNAKGTFVFVKNDTTRNGGAVRPDTLAALPDSLRAPPDSAPAFPDSLPAGGTRTGEKVIYSAQEVEFWVESKVVNFREEVTVDYGTLTLTAGKVRFFADRRYMEAEEDPVLVDHGGESKKVEGGHMDYNLESHEGTISGGETETESGFIYSERLRQIGQRQFLARGGNFTTCELAEHDQEPHFHFTSKKMRIYLNDKVIAKPVVMYIRDIPVLAIPYYVFSIRKGRHSGFLAADLDLGVGSNTGRYFRNLGYYWAASEYWDLMATTEYSENPSRFAGRAVLKYAKRYLMTGSINAAKVMNRQEYDITGAHNMELGPWRVSGLAEFRSDDFRQNQPLDPNLGSKADRKLVSNASISRSFPWQGTFFLSFRQEKDLNPELQTSSSAFILNETLPQYSFSINPRNLGRVADEHQKGRWPFLSTVRVDFSSSGTHQHTVQQFRTDVQGDSVTADTTLFSQESDRQTRARHTMNISDSRKLGNYLNIIPRFTVTENWVDREFSQNDTTKGFNRAATWVLSATANTKLFGTLPGIGPIRALRHVFFPQASLSFSPEFESLTYTHTQVDSTDTTTTRLPRFPGVSAQESRFMSLSLEQSLQAKIGSGETPKKVSLFRWNLGTRYDFLAEERGGRPWGQISSNFTELLGSSLSFSSSHDPYRHFRFDNFQVTGVGYRLSGRLPGGGDDLTPEGDTVPDANDESLTSLGADPSLGAHAGARRGANDPLTWSASFGISYAGNRDPFTDDFRTTAGLNAGFEARLTKNWNLSYQPIRWNITDGEIEGDSFQLTRYLHCWEATFGRSRYGDETSFYFKLGIRDLPDIRYQQGRQGATGLEALGDILP